MLTLYLNFFMDNIQNTHTYTYRYTYTVIYLPIRMGNNGDMLTIPCSFLINMMEECLPIRIVKNVDMPTIFCNFFMNMGGKFCANLMISLKISWKDGY